MLTIQEEPSLIRRIPSPWERLESSTWSRRRILRGRECRGGVQTREEQAQIRGYGDVPIRIGKRKEKSARSKATEKVS